MANWANRILAVVNTFTGRPSPTNVEAIYQVRAPAVNANFQGSLLAVAFCQALGTECANNGSTNILCKLKLIAGRFVAGDRVTVIEDLPTGRVWCALVTAEPVTNIPLVEFADAQLQDATLAGTTDYDTIRADLLIVETAPLDSFVWPKQAILVGGAHGLSGTVIPWQFGNTQTIEAKLLAAVGPAGADTQVQFNDGGNMGGAGKILYDKVTGSTSIGTGNTFTGLDSLAHGKEAKASLPGQLAHAGGKITAVGDNQFGRVPAGIYSADMAAHLLYALPLAASATYNVRGLVTARDAAGVSSGWKFEGVVENTGGTSRVVPALVSILPTVVSQDVAAAAWVVTIDVNDTTDTLDFSVQDPGGATINWGLTLEWEEVTL